jgi:hypothetical protein
MEQNEIGKPDGVDMTVPPHRHSKVITGFRTLDGFLHWAYTTRNLYPHEDESIEVRFFMLIKDTPSPQKGDALKTLLKETKDDKVSWVSPGRKEWIFDLDRMKTEFGDLQELDWCRGRAYVEPEFEVKREIVDIGEDKHYETSVVFYINPEVLNMRPFSAVPVEIQQSLRDFQADYPDPSKVAFIMMQFGKTPAHNNIVQGIRDALKPHGITGVRADDKDYHTDLTWNVMTYLHGCGFGIAVFERIERDDFNPNVSLEVGYVMALGKKVCLLKDTTLTALQSDLVGKLYKAFDPQDPVTSIPPILRKWMTDWRII